jgi:hypothetical protein
VLLALGLRAMLLRFQRTTSSQLAHGAGSAVLQMGFDRGNDHVLAMSQEIGVAEVQAARGIDHDAFIEDAIQQIDQLHTCRLTRERHDDFFRAQWKSPMAK